MFLTQFDWKKFGPLHPVLIKRTRNLLHVRPGTPLPHLAKQLAVMPYFFWKDAVSGHGLGLALLFIQESAGLMCFVLLSSGVGSAGTLASAPFRSPTQPFLPKAANC